MHTDTRKHREAFRNVISIKSRSNRTIENYCGHLNRFFERFKNQITKATTSQLTEYILNSGSASTMAQVHTTLNLFYKLVIKRDIVEKYIPYPDKSQYFPSLPSHDKIVSIINGEKNTKHRLIMRILYASGIRVSELVNLKWCDINRESGTHPLSMRIVGKGKRCRIIPLSKETYNLLIQYCHEYNLKCNSKSHYVFGNEKPYSIRSVQKIVQEYQLSPHDFRRMFGREQRKAGTDIGKIQELYGHSSLQTTRLYTGTDNMEAKLLM